MNSKKCLGNDTVIFFGIKKKYLFVYFPILLVLLNLILKFLFISSTSIGGDEPFSIYHAQTDVSAIIDLMKSENNPPLHFLILHFWIKLFGISAFSVRFLSVIFSSLAALVIYQIGNKFFSFATGVIGSLLFSFSNLNILLAHEARVYSLFVLLASLSMYYFLNIYHNKSKISYYILFLLCNTLLVYAHYFGFFIIISQTLVVLLVKDVRKTILTYYLIYLLLLFCLYIPNVIVLISRFSVSSQGTWVGKPNGITAIYDMFWAFSNQPVTTVFCIALLIIAIIKMILCWKRTDKSNNIKIILIWFAFPFLFMFVISYFLPMFLNRYLIFVTPAYYLTIAFSVNFVIQNKRYQNLIYGMFILLFLSTFNPDPDNKSRAIEIVEKIKTLKDKKTSVIICHSYFMLNFAYYYSKEIFSEVDNGNLYKILGKRLGDELIFPINSAEYIHYDQNRILFLDVDADASFPGNNIYNSLSQKYKLKNKFSYFKNLNVYEFER
jgi:uncharacterized membrane protein